MFHPLLPDMSTFKDTDIDNKIAELSRKYSIAARSGDGGLCSQILMALDGFKAEQQRRFSEKTKIAVKNQDKDLGDLINVN